MALGKVNRFGSLDSSEGGTTTRNHVILHINHKLNDDEQIKSLFYFSQYSFDLWSNFTFFLVNPTQGDAIHQRDRRSIYGMIHQYEKQYHLGNGGNLAFSAGMNLRYDDIKDLSLQYVINRERANGYMAKGNGTVANIGLNLGLRYDIKKWRIQPGLRLDYFDFNYYDQLANNPSLAFSSVEQDVDAPPISNISPTQGRGMLGKQAYKLSPKFNVYFSPNHNTQVYLKLGSGFHSNDLRSVILTDAKQALPSFYNADLGLILRPVKGLIVQPTVWASYLENEFVWNGDSYGVENVGKTRRFGVDLSLRYQPLSWLYLDVDANFANPRQVGAPKGQNYLELAPIFSSTGGIAVVLPFELNASLHYRYMARRPANEDYSIATFPYLVNDLVLAYNRAHWGTQLTIQNLFNVQYNEAMFATETKLPGETEAITDLTITPSSPIYLKLALYYKW